MKARGPIVLWATAMLAFVRCSSSPPPAPPPTILAGPYQATGAGAFSEIIFFDGTNYGVVRSGCVEDDPACFEHGTYELDTAHDTLTLTSSAGQATALPFQVGATDSATTGQSLNPLGGGLLTDGGSLGSSDAGAALTTVTNSLIGKAVWLVRQFSAGKQSFGAGGPGASQNCPLSPMGQAVVQKLQSAHGGWKNTTWQVTCDNSVPVVDPIIETPPGSSFSGAVASVSLGDTCDASKDTNCDPDFGIQRCSTQNDCADGTCTPVAATVSVPGAKPISLCIGTNDRAFDRIYGILVQAKKTILISSLFPIDGDGYGATLRNALTYLNALPQGSPPLQVRVLVGQGLAAEDNKQENVDVAAYLAHMTQGILPNPKIHVSVGSYGSAPFSWNHSKIIEVDGQLAIVGGHAWSQDVYNGPAPIHDMSLSISGGAAASAGGFVDYLWRFAQGLGSTSSVGAPPGSAAGSTPSGGDGGTSLLGGHLTVIAVGASGGTVVTPYSDAASDDAILTLIDAAKTTVRLYQQDLTSIDLKGYGLTIHSHLSNDLLKHMLAAMQRGVDVYVLLSGTQWFQGWSSAQTASAIFDYAAKQIGGAAGNLLCARLHVAALHDGTGALISNHSKVMILDDQVAYVGSQNLYPGDLSDAVITQLAEFGYILDDPTATESFVASWSSAWTSSKKHGVSGSDAPACMFGSKTTAPMQDCSSGWPACPTSQTCAWDGPNRGYCCKVPPSTSPPNVGCSGDSDPQCATGQVCSADVCTVPGTSCAQ